MAPHRLIQFNKGHSQLV